MSLFSESSLEPSSFLFSTSNHCPPSPQASFSPVLVSRHPASLGTSGGRGRLPPGRRAPLALPASPRFAGPRSTKRGGRSPAPNAVLQTLRGPYAVPACSGEAHLAAETDPKAEPEPRRGPRASPTAKSVPGGGDPGGAGCAAAAGRCPPVSAARPHVRLPGPRRRPQAQQHQPPPSGPRPRRPRRPDSAPRAHPGPPARGRPWGEAAGAAGGARGGDRRAQRLHVEGERTVTSRHSGRQTPCG